jgi:hypothetical protein
MCDLTEMSHSTQLNRSSRLVGLELDLAFYFYTSICFFSKKSTKLHEKVAVALHKDHERSIGSNHSLTHPTWLAPAATKDRFPAEQNG